LILGDVSDWKNHANSLESVDREANSVGVSLSIDEWHAIIYPVVFNVEAAINYNNNQGQQNHKVCENMRHCKDLDLPDEAQSGEEEEAKDGEVVPIDVQFEGSASDLVEVHHDEINIGAHKADLRKAEG
jgi:hypothetical protein